MKKILATLSVILLLVCGCSNMMNTPTKKVEEFLGKYQSMDSEVLAQLDKVVSSDTTMSDSQKEDYRSLMEKQYQNLSYKVKDERIDGNNAEVDVEIEVFDYATSISKSREYYNTHKDEFEDDKATINTDDDQNNNNVIEKATDELKETAKYIEYKIKQLKNVTDKVKYQITFHLTKVNDEWKVDDISDIDRKKIHGLFED